METLVFGYFVSTSPWRSPSANPNPEPNPEPKETSHLPAPGKSSPTPTPVAIPEAQPIDEPIVVVLPLF